MQEPGQPKEDAQTNKVDLQIGTPRFVRRKAFANRARLCAVCLSPLKKVGELGGWLVPQSYFCPKCGYTGYVYLEPDPETTKD
ncbi:MAG: hypothetical protein OK456_05840 [Thaumarchaeota archaeon]|nr:hypothetical protein [Nitrososphaerota archaeon]